MILDMIQSVTQRTLLHCDGCRKAWLTVEWPVGENDDLHLAMAVHGWMRDDEHQLDLCPRCKRKTGQ